MPERVTRRALSGWLDPALIFAELQRDAGDLIWLDAGIEERGFSYLGWGGSRAITADVTSSSCSLFVSGTLQGASELDIFALLKRDLAARGEESEGAVAGRFNLGWVGWFGYELAAQTIGARTALSRHPDAAFTWVDAMFEFDHAQRTVTSVALHEGGHLALSQIFEDARTRVARAADAHSPASAKENAAAGRVESAVWLHDDAAYLDMINRAQQRIAAGDSYLLCLTNTLTSPGAFDPVASYLALRELSPTHHGAFLRINEVALLSASPEVYLHVGSDARLTTKPIKGTRARGDSFEGDERLKAELQHDEKERAENLMIVDLMRNDIGRIAEVGTVAVDSLLEIESYPQVHQLVSTVSATLLPECTAVDAVRATFPAGSMTGAPKLSSVNILHELEAHPRGIYSGAFGYLGLDGAADLAMVIRSIVIDGQGATIGSGGGITADSDSAFELAEVKLKAAALQAALVVAKAERAGR